MLEKRRILETPSLNRILGDVSLVTEKRKPFDEVAKRPEIQLNRGNQTRLELFLAGLLGWDVACAAQSTRKSRFQTKPYACCSVSFFLRGDAFATFAFFAFDATFLPAALMTAIF